MKRLSSLGAALVAMTTLAGSRLSAKQARDGDEGIRDRFVGAWRLVWLEEPGAVSSTMR